MPGWKPVRERPQDSKPQERLEVNGNLRFVEVGEKVRVTGVVTGHTPGLKGFHIHEKGDCSDDKAMNAGAHFNPHNKQHGAAGAGSVTPEI